MRMFFVRSIYREVAVAGLLFGFSAATPSHAADVSLPAFVPAQALLDPISAYIANLPEIKRQALASQPSWVSPIVTTTGRLEQNIRYEQTEQVTALGAQTENFDNGKGARVIVADRWEVQANPPPIETRTVTKAANGTGDWQFTSVRYRVASANAHDGDYVLTVYSNFQAPTGSTAFTNHAWVFTPSIAAGKGFGPFDIQANLSYQLPASHYSTLGSSLIGNIAFQYHVGEYFWPQLEFNTTHFIDGPRANLTQVYITPGILFGRFALTKDNNFTFGIGYQKAIAPSKTIFAPALTPTYDHALILASRLSF